MKTTEASPRGDRTPITIAFDEVVRHFSDLKGSHDIAILNVSGAKHSSSGPIKSSEMMLCLIKSGSLSLKIDLDSYALEAHSLLPFSPKHYISDISSSEDFSAAILILTHAVMEQIMPKLTELLPVLIEDPMTPFVCLDEDEYQSLHTYFELLEKKLAMPDSFFKKQKVDCLVQYLMFEIMDMRKSKNLPEPIKRSRKEELMARFIISVSENFRQHREVGFYAEALCITPKHLSAVVKEISGRPAGEWIDQYVIMEAKVLLRSTDHTIQQISSILNFANQSFFGKYFKHFTGVSPTAFRNATV